MKAKEDLRLILGDSESSELVGFVRDHWDKLAKFCDANGLPFDPFDEAKTERMWVRAGFQAFLRSKELARKRGRPKGGGYANDFKILEEICLDALLTGRDPEKVAVDHVTAAEAFGELPQADRQTHLKRIKRQIRHRTIDGVFLYARRDRKWED